MSTYVEFGYEMQMAGNYTDCTINILYTTIRSQSDLEKMKKVIAAYHVVWRV